MQLAITRPHVIVFFAIWFYL